MPHPRLPLLPVFLPRRPFASQKSLSLLLRSHVQNFDQSQLQSISHRHNQQCRTFFTPLVQETANLLTTSASLLPVPTPWYLVLPLFAIFLRTSTTLPLTIYSRKVCIQLVRLQPLMSAWGRVLGSQAARKSRKRQVGGVDGGIAENLSPHDWEVRTRQATTKTRDDLAKRWGCQAWKKYVSMGQIPIWAVASFTIRGISTEHSSSTATAAGIGIPPSPPQELSGTSGAGNAIEGGMGEVIPEPGYIQSLLDSIPLQESLSTGGALWFPDLLSPDPLYLFPIALSLSMFANSEVIHPPPDSANFLTKIVHVY